VNPDAAMCDAFRERFDGLPNVRVIQSRFQELEPHDCFVSAGNAFGIMTAGIDAAVVALHGEDLMKRVQHRIRNEYLGEQPIGTCFIEPTGNGRRLRRRPLFGSRAADVGCIQTLPESSPQLRLGSGHPAPEGDHV
jgi:hypothetical protein